eukprot:TRINITY_DN62406_c0_g1_i1.p1 TRINITY_DN62406_c0_g1~~TRINITY_DN62406_c0_g1_i1.p1  ORF type:complete len:514 (-),score=96.38 TRINITY_DN62406_c0_g1_i1:77-1618(-)
MALAVAATASLATAAPGHSLSTGDRILTSARRRESEVARLKSEAQRLREEQERWTEFRNAGTPRRVAASKDAVYDASRLASVQEREARRAASQTFAERQALDEAARSSRETLRRAEEAARRAEEQLAAASRSFAEWRRSAEASAAEGHARRTEARNAAEARLATAIADGETRSRTAHEDLAQERERCQAEIRQVQRKLQRQHEVREAHGEQRRTGASIQRQCAEATASSAEARRDKQCAAAAYRAERSEAAAIAKVRQANYSYDSVQEKSSLRLEQAEEERDMRLRAARAKESQAREDLQRRTKLAEKQIAAAKEYRDKHAVQCKAVEDAYTERICKLRAELKSRTDFWETSLRESEVDAAERVSTVEALARQLEESFVDEVKAAEERVQAEQRAAEKMLDNHCVLLDRTLAGRTLHTATVLNCADSRVSESGELASRQLAESERRGEQAVDQAFAELSRAKGVAGGRLNQAVGHLMNYLDGEDQPKEICSGGPGLSLEMWIPLAPGVKDEAA